MLVCFAKLFFCEIRRPQWNDSSALQKRRASRRQSPSMLAPSFRVKPPRTYCSDTKRDSCAEPHIQIHPQPRPSQLRSRPLAPSPSAPSVTAKFRTRQIYRFVMTYQYVTSIGLETANTGADDGLLNVIILPQNNALTKSRIRGDILGSFQVLTPSESRLRCCMKRRHCEERGERTIS